MKNFIDEGRALHAGKYRPDIDGIRAIAVLSVVINHAFPNVLSGGFVGVDIFFVISGYLISQILLRNFEEDKFSLLTFYERRIRRIFPALVLVLYFVILFGWLCLFRPEFLALGRHVVASTLFSENFLLWSESGYFDTDSKLKPTLHLWSLAIEEQFYIFWPILMYAAFRLRINFLVVISILAFGSFAINLRDIHAGTAAAYYSPLGRSWELMIGSALAYLNSGNLSLTNAQRNICSLVGAILIGSSLLLVGPESAFPGFWALLPTLGTALLLVSGETAWVNRKILSTSPMVWCGLISYPLYLWHWPFLSFGYIIFGNLSVAKSTLCVIAAFIAAFLTYFLLERPIRRTGTIPQIPKYLAGAMLVMLASGALVATHVLQPRLKSFEAPTANEWDFLENVRRVAGGQDSHFFPLHPDRPDQVLFIGDSHLMQYASRIEKVIDENPSKPGALFAVLPGCLPIEGWSPRQPDMCGPLKDKAYRMAEEGGYKTVVIGAAWDIYFSETGQFAKDGDKWISAVSEEGRKLALSNLRDRISKLVERGIDVVLVLDNPYSEELSPTGPQLRLSFSMKNFQPNGTVSMKPQLLALHDELSAWAYATGARIIDPKDTLCDVSICKVTTGSGQPLYRNRDHFNPDWALNHATFIDPALGP